MPVTVPYSTADLPPFNDYAMRGRTYRFAAAEPLYPFGFGLGYGKPQYGPLKLDASSLAEGGAVTLRTSLRNAGSHAVNETVQCYIQPPRGWQDAPLATLVDFQKIAVPAGATVQVEFRVPSAAFAQFDKAGRKVHHPGRYGIVVGSASPGARAQALGAPAPALGKITLV
jgi:beta-glucosidase